MTKFVLGIGAFGLSASVIWWASFYFKVLDLIGATMTTKDLEKGVAIFSDCMFWDRAHCLAAKEAVKSAGLTPYQPLFAWLSIGVLLVGVLLAFQSEWNASGRARPK